MRLSRALPLAALLALCAVRAGAVCRESGFEMLSWNLQTYGHIKPERRAAVRKAYEAVVSSNVYVLAVQEIAGENGMETFLSLLPGGTEQWAASFQDTRDAQDNAIVFRRECSTVSAQGFLFEDKDGRPDTLRALHPVRWAKLKTGALEYTLLSLHLTFQQGDAAESARELDYILDWAARSKAGEKEGFILAGDFNLPTEKGKALSKRAREKKWTPLELLLRKAGAASMGVYVDEPTSRPHKQPGNNYDHFLVSQRLKPHVVKAGRLPPELVDEADHGRTAMVSDHYPVMLELALSTAPAMTEHKEAR